MPVLTESSKEKWWALYLSKFIASNVLKQPDRFTVVGFYNCCFFQGLLALNFVYHNTCSLWLAFYMQPEPI